MASDPRAIAAPVSTVAEIVDVRLLKVAAETNQARTSPLTLPFAIDVNITQSTALLAPGESPELAGFVVQHDYVIGIDSDDQAAARIECSFAAAFAHPVASELSGEQIEAFGVTTGTMAIYPYVRELVQSLSSRFGFPVLMPILRSLPAPSSIPPPATAPPKKAPAKTAPRRAPKAKNSPR